ncbi:MAG: NFACT family protein [Bacteroides sp.]|nr:NFACT family protein [Prevotella sp.]MCM1408628.1 NFACT family protein [Treponema brennaborense]MCM1470702.1 NFACT family protein [Bacteroides sp.]
MSLNCNEINVILSELDMAGSFIQRIVQPGFDSVALYLYKAGCARTLFVSLAAGACRLHETRRKIPPNEKPLRFMEFLRSRIKGAKIVSCAQLGLERIVRLELTRGGEQFFMFIRLWSGAANIIVTDGRLQILDVFFRRPKRGEISGAVFCPPSAETPSVQAMQEAAQRFPVRAFPQDRDAASGQTEQGAEGGQTGGAPKLPFNEYIDSWYAEHAETLSRTALSEQAEKQYAVHRSRMEQALLRLEEKRSRFLAAEQWKHQGDLILSYGHLIRADSPFLECIDYDSGAEIRIPIDPSKRAHDNAAVYYEKYKKALSGLENLEYDIKKAKSALAKLDADYKRISAEQNPVKMRQLLLKQTKPVQQIEKTHPGIAYEIRGWHVLVGRTAAENDELLRHHVRGQDFWLHTRDFAGGYVFIKHRAGKTVPLDVLLDAANLAVYHSKARKARSADIYYTQVKYLRRAKNAPKGTVLPTHEKNLSVTIEDERLRNLESMQLR